MALDDKLVGLNVPLQVGCEVLHGGVTPRLERGDVGGDVLGHGVGDEEGLSLGMEVDLRGELVGEEVVGEEEVAEELDSAVVKNEVYPRLAPRGHQKLDGSLRLILQQVVVLISVGDFGCGLSVLNVHRTQGEVPLVPPKVRVDEAPQLDPHHCLEDGGVFEGRYMLRHGLLEGLAAHPSHQALRLLPLVRVHQARLPPPEVSRAVEQPPVEVHFSRYQGKRLGPGSLASVCPPRPLAVEALCVGRHALSILLLDFHRPF
mmetsp:Transcript_25403/g.58872  ORF Transcript_25403/g.58872 Transcript_25403/m.58872 type:complete len:260 (-) Transcript_25403:614-1393(-)